MNRFKILSFGTLKFAFTFLIFILGFLIADRGFAQAAREGPVLLDSGRISAVISMDFKDASLKDVLKAFSIQSGINFIASQEIEDKTVTLYLDNVSVKEAMDSLFKASNLEYEYHEQAKIILVEKAEEEIKTITRIIPLKYAHVSTSSIQEEMSTYLASEDSGGGGGGGSGKWRSEEEAGITSAIKGLLSENGKLIEDPRTNSLIITDLPNRFPMIEKTIEELDVPIPQVMLEVEMIDVSKSIVDKLGFNFSGTDFGENPLTIIFPDHWGTATRFFLGDLSDKGKGIDSSNVAGSVIMGNTFAGLLDFFHSQTDTRYLARPRILTLNNETAEIKITTDEVIGEALQYDSEGTVTGRTAERADVGVSLRITPQVNMKTREITMFLVPSVIESSTSTFTSSYSDYRDIEERGTKSLVKVRDGETVILGGLIRNITYEIEKKVPLLGDIPILGALFRHKYKEKDVERELLVFITPHIVEDAVGAGAEEHSAVFSSREQDGLSKEARLLNIETALNNYDLDQY